MSDDYKDIIDLPYDGVKHHRRMTMYERAAQLMPFAALGKVEYLRSDSVKKKE